MIAETLLTRFQTFSSIGEVDEVNGIIKGVSVLSIGPARGHGITIDRTGLEQCLQACRERGAIKLIVRHDGEVLETVGSVENFSIVGDQVKGDAILFENHPNRKFILEYAKKLPKEFGLSIECDPLHEDRPEGGKLFRTNSVDAIAIVQRPAANRALFSRKEVDIPPNSNRKKRFSKMIHSKTLLAACDKIRTKFEGETIPSSEELADAIVEAVTEAVAPAVESAVAEVKTTVDEQGVALKKLEEGPAEPSDEDKEKATKLAEEEKKKDEEKIEKLAEKLVDEKITKLSAVYGLKRPPSSGSGFEVGDEKTKLQTALAAQKAAGAKNDAEAKLMLARNQPELYNAARANGLL